MNDASNPLIIRAIEPADYPQWLPLWQAYQTFYEVALSEEVGRTTFKRFLDTAEPVFAAVAVQDGQLVGFVHAVLHRSTWALNDFCYLEDLYVAPDIRGAGTGKALIEWVRDVAREQECARLYWHTHRTNERAQKLYNWIADNSGCIEYRMAL
ncbi:GNAT family N-acetyltransferase [Pseudomonas putida]|uniref:GNAT family N-acetyltransferase n=1 Tax=Pseudomonas putida TaxID=303 RepID=UPI002363E473|nr:GNAT family N-acetyltransferase [Pseudomonas putida]MDD2054801.1 GNAT family N-acetyltransferase [Pseudomonas putida]